MASERRDSQANRAAAFGSRIRQLRRAAKLNQREVADRVHMSAGNWSRLENGLQGPPADEVIQAIAAVFEVDAGELFALAGRQPSDFETRVLRELAEIRAGIARLERAMNS